MYTLCTFPLPVLYPCNPPVSFLYPLCTLLYPPVPSYTPYCNPPVPLLYPLCALPVPLLNSFGICFIPFRFITPEKIYKQNDIDKGGSFDTSRRAEKRFPRICPLCEKPGVVNLSSHFEIVRDITGPKRSELLKEARVFWELKPKPNSTSAEKRFQPSEKRSGESR